MSVLIKGMEMPENCGNCPISLHNYQDKNKPPLICGLFYINFVKGIDPKTRMEDCPLAEVTL